MCIQAKLFTSPGPEWTKIGLIELICISTTLLLTSNQNGIHADLNTTLIKDSLELDQEHKITLHCKRTESHGVINRTESARPTTIVSYIH